MASICSAAAATLATNACAAVVPAVSEGWTHFCGFTRRWERWGDRWDSNPQQPESQSGTLPLSYGHHCKANSTSGLPGGTRTHNPQLRRLVLYPVELRADIPCLPGQDWSGWRDLNSRHPAPKAGALPGCATPRNSGANDTLFWACSRGPYLLKSLPSFFS